MSTTPEHPTPDDLELDPLEFGVKYESYLREELLPNEEDETMRTVIEAYLSAISEVTD